ncbi:MAG: GNAT family N-acetyltransferase [Candidatus Thorarchaeota archaeon]
MELPFLEYRVATPLDMDEIVNLWKEIQRYHEELDPRYSMVDDAAFLARSYYSERMDMADNIFFVATLEKQLIGFVFAYLQKKPPVYRDLDMGFIDTLMVTTRYRRSGIGSHLVDLVKQWLIDQGIHRLQLSVASMNQIGIAFWERCGFKELSRRMESDI